MAIPRRRTGPTTIRAKRPRQSADRSGHAARPSQDRSAPFVSSSRSNARAWRLRPRAGTDGMIGLRKQMDEPKYSAHRAIPGPARQSAADGLDYDVGRTKRSAPPQHRAGPQHGEDNGAPFQWGGRLHGELLQVRRGAIMIAATAGPHREMGHVGARFSRI